MELAIILSTIIILFFLRFIFRKPIKKINDSSDRIGEVVKNKINMWADSAIVAASENKKRYEERLKDVGITESLDEIRKKYSQNKS